MSHKQTVSIRDQKCVKVVVFTDRAEVERTIKTTLKQGENELIITAISNSIDRDSVRVEGRGNATVLDVVCQDKRVEADNRENISSREKELKTELHALETKRDLVVQQIDRAKKQTEVLNEFAASLSKSPLNKVGAQTANVAPAAKENVDSFLGFLSSYSAKLEELDSDKYKLDNELKKLNEQIQVVNENLFKLSYSYDQTV